MSLRQIASWQYACNQDASPARGAFGPDRPHRHAVTRRQFLRMTAGGAGAALGTRLWQPPAVHAAEDASPRPIPGGIQLFGPESEVFHVFGPEPGNEPATITDFSGIVGVAFIRGTGTGTDTQTGTTTRLTFDVDMRFMEGTYIAVDGKQRQGTFGFI